VIAALDELDDVRSFVRQASVWLEGVAVEPDGPHAD
jgi:hypothetical protein